MNVDSMTIGDAKKLVDMLGGNKRNQYPVEIGKSYVFRCVTYHMIGKIEEIVGDFAVLSTASWLALSDRWNKTITSGSVRELEYVGDTSVNMSHCSDITEWKHDLPTDSV